jgi:hypothetical protein
MEVKRDTEAQRCARERRRACGQLKEKLDQPIRRRAARTRTQLLILSMSSTLFSLVLCFTLAAGIGPKFSWDTVGNMTFFHSCNETGPFSPEALQVIVKFPMVTIEKGQGFHDSSVSTFAEPKIIDELRRVKALDSSICTVFYMNSVLSWCVWVSWVSVGVATFFNKVHN